MKPKNKIWLLFIFFNFTNLYAQNNNLPELNTPEQINFLESQSYNIPYFCTLKANFYSQTPKFNICEYQLYAYDMPVLNNTIKTIASKQTNKIIKTINNLDNYQTLNAIQYYRPQPEKHLISIPNFTTDIIENIYYKYNQSYVGASFHRFGTSLTDSIIITQNITKQILLACQNSANLKQDTIMHINVFMPDPLTTNKKIYGGSFVNNADANAPWLDFALTKKTVPTSYEPHTGLFTLENKYAKIIDQSAPHIIPTISTANTLLNTRNQTSFEETNALYHITQFHQHIDSLGYNSLVNTPISLDVHGQNGADNSAFMTLPYPYIDMGDGGVNDAEDADVIIHEDSHYLSYKANNNLLIYFERKALDEGLADYFATSYSHGMDTFRSYEIFNWDGHNEYWPGRVANTTLNYTTNTTLGMYKIGEIWNSVLTNLMLQIGKDKTDRLMLEAMHFFTNNTTFEQAADYILFADSVYYNNIDHELICNAFKAKGIFSTNACTPNQINNISTQNINPQVLNQLNFANSIEALQIILPEPTLPTQISVVNNLGQLMLQYQTDKITYIYPNQIPNPGVYMLLISQKNGQYKTTFVKN